MRWSLEKPLTAYDSTVGQFGQPGDVTLRNIHTGKVLTFKPSGVPAAFRRKCSAFESACAEHGSEVYFVTFTLSDKFSGSRSAELHRIRKWFRQRFSRAGSPYLDVWVVELQKKRYLASGVAAAHWHFVIGCVPGGLPDVEFRADRSPHYVVRREGSVITASDLYSEWGLGQVLCVRAYRGTYRYLCKYLEKSVDDRVFADKYRRWGGTRFGYAEKQAWKREVHDWYIRNGMLDRGCHRLVDQGSRLVEKDCKAGAWVTGLVYRSPWQAVGPGLPWVGAVPL